MPSEFYIWTHAYDLSGIASVNLKIRIDADGVNPLANNENETYAGAAVSATGSPSPCKNGVLPNTQNDLNTAANNGQINYFIQPPELADYYFAKISNSNVNGFRDQLLDYYIEATDSKGNVHKSEIQHVYVEDDGAATEPPSTPAAPSGSTTNSYTIELTWTAVDQASGYNIFRDDAFLTATSDTSFSDTPLSGRNGLPLYLASLQLSG